MRKIDEISTDKQLDELPPLFVKDVYNRKCDAVYQHLYENYYGEGRSVYAAVM